MKTLITDNQGTKPALPKLAFTTREAAACIGVSYISMHRLIKRGLIKSSSALRTKLIARTELERFLKESAQ
jgi:hypothetical protein